MYSNWKIAVSKEITGSDTIWVGKEGSEDVFAVTDGTNPNHVEGEIADYVINVGCMKVNPQPLRLNSVGGIGIPTRGGMNNGGMVFVAKELIPFLMQRAFGKGHVADFFVEIPETKWFK